MKKSENIQITEFDKKANVHNMELLPVYAYRFTRRL